MPVTLTNEEVELLITVMNNADVYITDDHHSEMTDDMADAGYPNYEDDVEAIYYKLRKHILQEK